MKYAVVDFHGVTPIGPEMFPCVLLREPSSGRVLPLWVTATAADELDLRDAGILPRRPNSYDLLVAAYHEMDGVVRVRIDSGHQGVFAATLVLGNDSEVDVRASDAIIIARILDLPIEVAEDVLSQFAFFVSPSDLARYFDLVVEEAEPVAESPEVTEADAEFEELMRNLGVSEDDLRGDLS